MGRHLLTWLGREGTLVYLTQFQAHVGFVAN